MHSRRPLPCQCGSGDELAIMLGRQSKPMEISSPDFVVNPLWQATQRSEVRNSGFNTPCLAPPRTKGAETITVAEIASAHQIFFCITSLRLTFRLPSPREDRTSIELGARPYSSSVCVLRGWRGRVVSG